MPITLHKSGGTSISGKTAVDLYRLLTIRQGLMLEIKTDGRIRLTRGPKMTTVIRRELGFKGSREAQLAQLDAYIEIARRAVEVIDNRSGEDC